MQDLEVRHAGSSSLIRDWTQVPCIGSVGPQPLDHQGSRSPPALSKVLGNPAGVVIIPTISDVLMNVSPWHCCSCPFLAVTVFSFSWLHFFPSDQQYVCIGRLVGLPHYLLRGFVLNFLTCMDFGILFHYPCPLIFLGNCWLSWAQSICPRPNMRNASVCTKRQPYHRTTTYLSLQRVVASARHHERQRWRLESLTYTAHFLPCLCAQGNLPPSGNSK